MGNAGIVRELLRYARIQECRDPGYAITWPDHPPAIPAVISRRANPAGQISTRPPPQIPGGQLPWLGSTATCKKGGPSER